MKANFPKNSKLLLSSTFSLVLCGISSQASALSTQYFTSDASNVTDSALSVCAYDGETTGGATQSYTLTLSATNAAKVKSCNGTVNIDVSKWLWTMGSAGACYTGDLSVAYGTQSLYSERYDDCESYGSELSETMEYQIPVSSLSGFTDTFTVSLESDVWTECYDSTTFDQAGSSLDISWYVSLTYDSTATCTDDIERVAAGWYHSFAIRGDDTLWAWGQNTSSQLGDGTATNRTTAVQVTALSSVSDVDGGAYHSLAVKSDGSVYGWGKNTYGQVGDGTTTTRKSPTLISTLSSVTDVDAGSYHSLALKSDGTVKAWGQNTSSQLGDGTTTNRKTPVSVSTITGVTDISAGNAHSLAVKSDGTVWSWGKNTYYQLGDGTVTTRSTPVQASNITSATSVSAGYEHSMALKSDGTVWTWGRNNVYQLGNGTTTSVKKPTQLTGINTISSIATGANHSMAIRKDGTMWLWGKNDQGQIGNATTTTQTTPVAVTNSSLSSTSGIYELAGGYQHTVSLERYGNVWSWGDNAYGQLGNGTTADSTSPVQTTETW